MCLYNRLGWHLMLPPIVTLTWGHCNKQAQSPYDLRCHKPLLMKQTDIIVVPQNLCLEAVVDGVNYKTRIFIQCLCLFAPLRGCVRGIVRVATGQGKVREIQGQGKSQGILEFVREIWNFVESQGNSRKVREI